MKNILLTVITILTVSIAFSEGLEDYRPEIHAEIALQYEYYRGEDAPDYYYTVPDNVLDVRNATIKIVGHITDIFHYNAEMGVSKCPFGLGSGMKLLEAGVLFKPVKFLKAGIQKGHILRGFELRECCLDVLTAEKPKFATAVSVCHPTGIIINFDHSFTENTGLETEFAYMNDPTGTLKDGRHDINIGTIIRTPLPGLSASFFYTRIKTDFESDETLEKGWRSGFGVDYDNYNILARSEYYLIKGFTSDFEGASSSDLEMRAFYIQGGYRIRFMGDDGFYVLPYGMYQWWDKGSNVPGDHRATYLVIGANIGLSSHVAFVRIDYDRQLSHPVNTAEEADRLIIRLQTGI